MQERPSASISLIACGIVSGYSPPCSMVSKRRPVPSICGSCGRLSGVISANSWMSFMVAQTGQNGSRPSYAAEQKFENRNRQYDSYDHHHHTARRDHRLGFSDDARRRDLSNIDPALGHGELWWRDLWWLDIYLGSGPWCSHRCFGSDPWCPHRCFIRQHLRHRVMPTGLMDFLLNCLLNCIETIFLPNCVDPTMSPSRCRVPAMILAMPIDVNRTKMLTRLGLGHARFLSF